MKEYLLSMNKKERPQKISHIIIGIILPTLLVFLILLIFIDIFAIYLDKQNNINAILQSQLLVANNMERHIDTTNNYLFTIYQDNNDYAELTQALPYSKAYSHAADLNVVVGRYQAINKELDGYFIAYEGGISTIGRMNHEIIPTAHQNLLKQQVAGLMGTSTVFYEFVSEIEGRNYHINLYKSGQICVAFVTVLDKYAEEVEQLIPFEGKGKIYFSSSTLNSEFPEFAAEYAALSQDTGIQKNINIRSSVILGHKVGNRDLWLLFDVKDSALNRFSFVTNILVLMTFALIFSIIIVLYFTRKKIVRPMYQLVDMMLQFKQGNIQTVNDLKLQYYEMQLMNSTLADMIKEISRQKANFYEEKINRQTTELQFLQAQLQPHFYLNCLKALNAKAHDAGIEDMQELIFLISDYLRNCLSSVQDMVSLKEELNLTDKYVELQKKLSSREIQCHFTVEDGLDTVKVPTFCVQSFVENSIKYAQNKQNRGYLEIQVIINKLDLEDDSRLDITVMDSGQGYDEKLLGDYNRKQYYASGGIGINNIKRRCDVLYGDAAEYMFYNMGGAVSELILPLEVKDTSLIYTPAERADG